MRSRRSSSSTEIERRLLPRQASAQDPRSEDRQHYLRWRAPTTWQNWEDAGLDYDSTVGYADHVGFRAGTCYEYPIFNRPDASTATA